MATRFHIVDRRSRRDTDSRRGSSDGCGSTLFIGLYGCLYWLTQLGIVPDIGVASALSFGWETQAFGAHEGYTQMALAGMNSLPFLLPYVMASLAIPYAQQNAAPILGDPCLGRLRFCMVYGPRRRKACPVSGYLPGSAADTDRSSLSTGSRASLEPAFVNHILPGFCCGAGDSVRWSQFDL